MLITGSGRGFVPESRLVLDGEERSTTVIGTNRVSLSLAASEVAVSRTITLIVRNPDGTESNTLGLPVTNPVPQLGTIIPASLMVGDPTRTLIVLGRSFRTNSVVLWNDVPRPMRYIAEDRLEVDLVADDVAAAGRIQLAVRNPDPEGGTAVREYRVNNVQPWIWGLSPESLTEGASDTTLFVIGENFLPGATVFWNGSARATTYVSSTRLFTRIAAADLSAAGSATVSVANPDPAVASSNDSTFWIHPSGRYVIDLIANDLAWDPVRRRLYASVHATDGRFPNEIVALDPTTGEVGAHMSPGLGPGQLALAEDASVLYATLDGEAAVARVDLTSFTRDLRFTFGTGTWGTIFAQDIEVMPGAAGTVAISRMNLEVRPAHEGVALYDNGVERPVATPQREGGNLIEFTSAATLYGYNNEDTGWQLFRMDVTDSGLVTLSATEGIVSQFDADIRAAGGWLCSTRGRCVDPRTGLLAATMKVGDAVVIGLVAPDPNGSRVYYVVDRTLYAFRTDTWILAGADAPPGVPSAWFSLTRWGADGFAYIGATQVVIFRSRVAGQ